MFFGSSSVITTLLVLFYLTVSTDSVPRLEENSDFSDNWIEGDDTSENDLEHDSPNWTDGGDTSEIVSDQNGSGDQSVFCIANITNRIWSSDGDKIAPVRCPGSRRWNCLLWIVRSEMSNPKLVRGLVWGGSVSDWEGDWLLFRMDREYGLPEKYNVGGEYWKVRSDGSIFFEPLSAVSSWTIALYGSNERWVLEPNHRGLLHRNSQAPWC